MRPGKKEQICKNLKLTKKVFEECWRLVPENMIKRLNCNDLTEYLARHILPTVSRRLIQSNAYSVNPLVRRVIAVA
ncbi:hypothetical protein LEP1GSC032_0530 [Leptospira interrogans str. 2002000631]|uniref:Uncharacterized protein n=1 Tax=Leptospira interrogans str. 2002000626 TaxID=996803 RepID=A0A829D3H7_LEPIR|nr:hypothetical protein LEP1GSC027_3979 [Leptospira interrogans str. 2002000624]EKQ46148.1 hypothetical protein LEP1GSC026_3172 [Leptospira interrogans str. 2002000623]EMJ72790.1 hypothetical protein LEP1GSC033_1511 [Leptospira interrogans str. 2002000632]EMJ76903.1 hypothetical protein LEP1GSC032_0574 [Leptospira interrogans str. 2002000631]EMY06264.1 hypothetical protein LEP1GSC029_3165 [Leptospira interrogans str. 2002000626]